MDPKEKKVFDQILEEGAKVDDIFKDKPMPVGSNPFTIQPLAVEEVAPAKAPVAVPPPKPKVIVTPILEEAPKLEENPAQFKLDANQPLVSLQDDDSLFAINRKYAALDAIFQLITKECSFSELITQILVIAIEQVKSEAGSFLEVDYEKDHVFFRAVAGRSSGSHELLNVTVPRGHGVVGFVCENQETMALSRIDENGIYLKSVSDSVGFETKNIVAVPVIIRGATFGCIELLNRIGEERYSDADKEVLRTIAEFAAKIIENRLVLAAAAAGQLQSNHLKVAA